MTWRVWVEEKPSGKFLVRRRHSSGHNLPSKTCSTKSLANELEKNWARELEYKDLGITDPKRSTAAAMKEFIDELIKNDQEEYPKGFYVVSKEFLATRPTFGDITRGAIVDYRTDLTKTALKPITINGRLRHLSAWLTWCVEQGYLAESPFKNIRMFEVTREPKFIVDSDIQRIDKTATGNMKLAWRINYTTGMRQKNLRHIQGIHIEGDTIAIPRPKGRRPLLAPIYPEVRALLPNPLPKGHLFPEYVGKKGKWRLNRQFDHLKSKAKVQGHVTWHGARHTFIKDALQSGLTTGEVMDFTGHVSPQSMDPYRHFEMERLMSRHRLIQKHRVKRAKENGGQIVGKLPQNLKSSEIS
jgi:integrase